VFAETPNVIDLAAGKNLLYLPVSPAAKAGPTAADPAVPAQAAAGFEKGGN
jgi:hypothetical protein